MSIVLIAAPTARAGQRAPAEGLQGVVTEASLERIRLALAKPPPLVIKAALTPTFYAQADATLPTFSAYLHDWAPPRGPARSGIDLLQLVRDGLRGLQQAQREREARQIRRRIDRELATLSDVK